MEGIRYGHVFNFQTFHHGWQVKTRVIAIMHGKNTKMRIIDIVFISVIDMVHSSALCISLQITRQSAI